MAVGIELNRWLVYYSKYKAWRAGVRKNTHFMVADLWKHDLSQYNTIVIFGVPFMMADLEEKLEKEMSDDAELIAGRFGLMHWIPTEQRLGEYNEY